MAGAGGFRPERRAASIRALLAGTALVAGSLLPSLAQAQVWQDNGDGFGDYHDPANWSTGNVPDIAGETATFASTGTLAVNLSGLITPDSWIFAADSRSFGIFGGQVSFGVGITNNANTGQLIDIG